MSYLLSEKHFRHYEDHLNRIVKSFPLPVVFDVELPIKQADVLARNIRYAARSLTSNQWTTKIDFAKFMTVWDSVEVSTLVNEGKVTCGPETTASRVMSASSLPKCPQIVPVISLHEPSDELITAVVVFHHHRYLTEASQITTSNAMLMSKLALAYDVAMQREGNTYTIL